MLSQLSIEGYRSIRSLSLDLGRLTVIEGANGVGKTNVYRALVLLQAATRGAFARLLAEEGGLGRLRGTAKEERAGAHGPLGSLRRLRVRAPLRP